MHIKEGRKKQLLNNTSNNGGRKDRGLEFVTVTENDDWIDRAGFIYFALQQAIHGFLKWFV